MTETVLLARRLANFHRPETGTPRDPAAGPARRERTAQLASRLAQELDAEVVRTDVGLVVRIETSSRSIPVDRDALARLPGQPPPHVPLICLDTETTGLGSAAGTVAFLVGLGWWEGQRFRQVQLLLPDHGEEQALLHMLASLIPPDGWLVSYNGRTFDWPLLVTRYRMARQAPPPHSGHLDLLTIVRRLFRHRMTDARLRTAEEALLGFGRVDDVEGFEIPGRYLAFLHGGPVGPLAPVVDHNDRDVRSLARLLAHIADELGDEERWCTAPDGDLLGLARSFRLEGRHAEAMLCLDTAIARTPLLAPAARAGDGRIPSGWLIDRSDATPAGISHLVEARAARVMRDQVAHERARLLRHLGRRDDARAAWQELAERSGPLSAIAWVELAKVLEHLERDFQGALQAVMRADRLVSHALAIGKPLPMLQAELTRRRARLQRRIAGGTSGGSTSRPARIRRKAFAHAVANG